MDGVFGGLARPAGGSTLIKWQGKTYELVPLTVRDLGTVENELLRRARDAKLSAVAMMNGKVPDEMFERLLHKALRECETLTVSAEQVQKFLDESKEGICFTLWLSLNKTYPGKFDLDEMTEVMLSQVTNDEVQRLLDARDQAMGIDAAGKEIGPAQDQAAEQVGPA